MYHVVWASTIHLSLHHSSSNIMRAIAVCKVQSRLETLEQLQVVNRSSESVAHQVNKVLHYGDNLALLGYVGVLIEQLGLLAQPIPDGKTEGRHPLQWTEHVNTFLEASSDLLVAISWGNWNWDLQCNPVHKMSHLWNELWDSTIWLTCHVTIMWPTAGSSSRGCRCRAV